jgi:outer membrane protein
VKYRAFALIVAVACLFAMTSLVGAQDEGTSSSLKIRVIDRKMVFDNYQKQKDELEKLKAEVKKLQAPLKTMADEIEAAKEAYEEKRDTMTEELRDTTKLRIQSDFAEYKAKFQASQSDVDGMHTLLIKQMKQDIDKAIAEIAEAEKYDLVLEADPKSPTGVLFSSSAIDVTSRIIAHLNGAK